MADCTWTGVTSNALDLAGNWTPALPGDTDTARFTTIGGSAYAPSTNMDGLANTLARITVAEECSFDIGGSGTPLKVQATEWQHYGSKKLWIDPDGDADTDVIVDCRGGGAIDIAAVATCAAANFHILNGDVTFGGACDITAFRIEVLGGNVTINPSANTIDEYVQKGGVVLCGPAIVAAIIDDGQIELTDNGISTSLDLFGGVVRWNNSGTIALARMYGGELDSKVYGGAQILTESWRYPGSRLVRVNELLDMQADHPHGGLLL